jgi:hypothetical protein
MRLPRRLANLHERARSLRTDACQAKRYGHGRGAESLFASFHAARRTAREAVRAYWRTSESSLFCRLEHAHMHNAHALYRMIDGLCPLPGKPPVSDDASSAEREAEAQRFLASFEAILCGHKAVPKAASSEFWYQFLPRGDGGDRLAARTSWQEVMMVVFPVHCSMGVSGRHVCVGGGAACILCSLERINGWDGSPDSAECEARISLRVPESLDSVMRSVSWSVQILLMRWGR